MEKTDKQYKSPVIVWLKMTDYMHAWIEYELGGNVRVRDQRVVCVMDLPGVREVMRMESEKTSLDQGFVGNSMSACWRNCIDSGFRLDQAAVERMYGITEEELKLFLPVECPSRCMNADGVLRPWGLDINFGKRQATAMQRILREEFWKAVENFDKEYAGKMNGKRYPAVDMIESFCQETGTPDLYVQAMRREWQRRVKRMKA